MEFYKESISEKEQVEKVLQSLKALDDLIDDNISNIRGIIKDHGTRREES